jgi:NAD(P)-dependent dehydrogenase (short-subunit alcohol dehydrogenase family)
MRDALRAVRAALVASMGLSLLAAGLLRWRRGGSVSIPDQHGRTVLVTGGNSGIGLAAATRLAEAGAHVVLTSRDPDRGAAAVATIRERTGSSRVEAMVLDLADPTSIRSFAASFLERYDRLDVLVNNAGLVQGEHTTTDHGVETTWAVNHLGPFLLTNLLLDRLRDSAPARIVNVASLAHRRGTLDVDDPFRIDGPFTGLTVYASTKLANVLFTRELARRLESTGVTANCCHPGTIRSGFGRDGDARGIFALLLTIARPVFPGPEIGAYSPLHLATAPELATVTGRYFDGRRERRPSRAARDDLVARRLWEHSAQHVGTPVSPDRVGEPSASA